MVKARNDKASKDSRRSTAEMNQTDRVLRTTEEQIDQLDTRLGLDRDSCRERARLYLRRELEELDFDLWEAKL